MYRNTRVLTCAFPSYSSGRDYTEDGVLLGVVGIGVAILVVVRLGVVW